MGNAESLPTTQDLLDEMRTPGRAFSRPSFYADNARANELKEEANALFRSRDFEGALAAYTNIIDTYDDRVVIDTIRTIRCNRAACYLNLGDLRRAENVGAGGRLLHERAAEAYQACVDDCNIVILFMGSESVTDKAHHRLELATKALDGIDEARRAADAEYRGRPEYDVDDRRRQQMQESSERAAKFIDQTVEEEHRPFGYVVRMKDHDPEYVHMRDMVPASLRRGAKTPDEQAVYDAKVDEFVRRIVQTHEAELMGKGAWKCYICGKKAGAWLHSPCADLTSFYPIIKDYARPICEKEGKCATAARAKMDEEEEYDDEIVLEAGTWIKM